MEEERRGEQPEEQQQQEAPAVEDLDAGEEEADRVRGGIPFASGSAPDVSDVSDDNPDLSS